MQQADPQEVATRWLAAMRRGDWAEGWRQTDRIELPRRERQRRPGFRWQSHHLVWDGTPFAGRSVLVRCEHGLGDTLQFIRFVPAIQRVARKVIVRVQPQLLPLLEGAPGLGQVLDGWTAQPPPPHDVEIEVMELAYASRCSPETVAPPYPHLRSAVAGRLPVRLPDDGRLRVGLLWAASEWDSSRSLPVAALERLLAIRGTRFFSLQQGDPSGVAQLERLGVVPLSQHTEDIAAAAAAMLEMDLVLTVDAMAAHLAATLGRPTWIVLKHESDWRWMDERADSPWYPTVRLWRQPGAGRWEEVIAAIEPALRALAAGRAAFSPRALQAAS